MSKCTAPKTGQHKSPTAAAACPACNPKFGQSLAAWVALAPPAAPGMPLPVETTGDAVANFEDSAWEPIGDATVVSKQHERLGAMVTGTVELKSDQYPDQVMIASGDFWVSSEHDGEAEINTVLSVSFRDEASGVTGPAVEVNDSEALMTAEMPWFDSMPAAGEDAQRWMEDEAAKVAHYTHLMTNGEREAEMLAWASALAKYGIENPLSGDDWATLEGLGLSMGDFDSRDNPMPTQEQVNAALAARA